MLRLSRTVGSGLLLVAFVFLTGQSGQAELVPLFGIESESLAFDGVLVFAGDGAPVIDRAKAEQVARGERLREDPVLGMELVRLRLPYEQFDGLAWAVAFDVAGKEDPRPGAPLTDSKGKFVYTFSITFVDATTGSFITSLSESALISEGEALPEPYKP